MTGEDAAGFLQGQFTADLRALGRASAVYGLWLEQRGKVIADSFVSRGEDGSFRLVSYSCLAADLQQRLEAYIIADDVTVIDETPSSGGVVFFGTEAAAGTAVGPGAGGTIFPGRRGASPAWEWIGAREQVEGIVARARAAGMHEVAGEALEAARLAAGIPAVPRDVGPGDLPQEAGLEQDAVAFDKGCYLGQEIMARLHAGGQVRRRLRRVQGRGGLPALPAPVFRQGRAVGELRSAVTGEPGHYEGLAMLTLFLLGPESDTASLALGVDQEPTMRVYSA